MFICRIVMFTVVLGITCSLAKPASGEELAVHVAQGDLRCTAADTGFRCLGIPYAAPPLQDLRFKAPAPPAVWQGVRDATQFASGCLQAKTEYSKAQQGSEDCLYLNVYSPRPRTAGEQGRLPVMVWLHGGGFINGSGNAFNGALLAKTADVIVVTVNYRLGPFGWLALPTLAAEAPDHSTGNYGLQDSLAALAWVQRNIAVFGGDSRRVTLFGQSAGGEQTLALIASPRAAGLFQRAISMSAPATLPMPTVEQAAAKRVEFLHELGCTEPAIQLACLRALPAERLLAAAHLSWDLLGLLGLQWTPTMDGVVLPDQWIKRFRDGQINVVPVMVGQTRDEGRLFVAIRENVEGAPLKPAYAEERIRKFFGLAGPLILRRYGEDRFPVAGDRMARGISDALFAAGLTANRAALAPHTRVYGYETCDPNATASHVEALHSKLGCAHDSDLPYLFQWDDHTGEPMKFNAQQATLAVTMGRYWGHFAATGNPNGEGLAPWPAQTTDSAPIQLLEIASAGGVRTVSADEYAARHDLQFWACLALLKKPQTMVGALAAIAVLVALAAWVIRGRRATH